MKTGLRMLVSFRPVVRPSTLTWVVNEFEIRQGGALGILRTLPAGSVHCCVTSPPYWGLRDYGIAPSVWGGSEVCKHSWSAWVERHDERATAQTGKSRTTDRFYGDMSRRFNGNHQKHTAGAFCLDCRAWRGCLGLEPTPESYVEHLVLIFSEVRRALRHDGTVWLNLGDSFYGGTGRWGHGTLTEKQASNRGSRHDFRPAEAKHDVLKPKDLVGIPWRVALALQADGWYLRSDIIWHKPNPMPESVLDRPTRAHDYLFLLAKKSQYYYDSEAIKEPISPKTLTVHTTPRKGTGVESAGEKLNLWMERNGGRYHPHKRNKRSVWTIATEPYRGAHFATYPTALVEPCIKAGTSARGCCSNCAAPWRRVVERASVQPIDYQGKWSTAHPQASARRMLANVRARRLAGEDHDHPFPAPKTVGWRSACRHRGHPVPCTVLDPFCGSGTSGVVALRLGRRFVGIELNAAYVEMARRRIAGDAPLLNTDLANRAEAI